MTMIFFELIIVSVLKDFYRVRGKMKLSDGKVKLLSRNYHKLHQCIYILYRQ
jgi:hypothetical protein